MMIAAAFMKPRMTGWETKLTMVPSFRTPRPSWMRPTRKARIRARPMNSSVKGTAKGVMAAAVIRETMATGPVESCRDEPHKAPRMAGTRAT